MSISNKTNINVLSSPCFHKRRLTVAATDHGTLWHRNSSVVAKWTEYILQYIIQPTSCLSAWLLVTSLRFQAIVLIEMMPADYHPWHHNIMLHGQLVFVSAGSSSSGRNIFPWLVCRQTLAVYSPEDRKQKFQLVLEYYGSNLACYVLMCR